MIITQDKDKNILIGNLEVLDQDGLKEIRDHLMQYRTDLANYERTMEDLTGYRSVLSTDYVKKGNLLVHNFINEDVVDEDFDQCSYTKETFASNFLNTILISTSLLGELDASGLDHVARQFIGAGIYRCVPLEVIWEACSNDLYFNRKKQNYDWRAFQNLLKLGLISYHIAEKISKEQINRSTLITGNCEDLQQIKINSDILLGNRSASCKKKKLR